MKKEWKFSLSSLKEHLESLGEKMFEYKMAIIKKWRELFEALDEITIRCYLWKLWIDEKNLEKMDEQSLKEVDVKIQMLHLDEEKFFDALCWYH